MSTPEKTRRELSAFLRANLDEYACYCTLWFDEVYSHQIASRMSDFSDRFEFAKSFIRGLSEGIASGKAMSFEASIFANVTEEPEFSELANSIALAMTMARRLAPLITQSCFGKPEKAREYRECLDEYLRGYVLTELEGFAKIASADRYFSRRWDASVNERLYEEARKCLKDGLGDSGSNGENAAQAHQDEQKPSAEQCMDGLQYLTRRERQVLMLLLEGKTNSEISAKLGVSQNTVKTHVSHVFDKLNVNSRIELLRKMLGE